MNVIENRKKWVEALRSDRFKQTTGYLERDGGGNCCLGVLCRLAMEDGVEIQTTPGEGFVGSLTNDTAITEFDGSRVAAPPKAMAWVGLADHGHGNSAGEYGPRGDVRSLAELNDGGKTFAEIADVIESEPEGLFA